MRLSEFECPNCGANEMLEGENQQLLCVYCGTSFGQVTQICPKCGHYNEEGVRHCSECGSPILRDCPVCGWDNWVLADHCVQCGRNMDLIAQMAQRWQQTTQERLARQREGMVELKEQEERASQRRMAAFLEVEHRRQEALARARAAQEERDRQVYMLVGVAVVAFIVLLVLALLLTGGSD